MTYLFIQIDSRTLISVGDTFTVFYNGVVAGNVQSGLTAEAVFEVTEISGTDWTFTVDVTNTSSSPVTASRVSAIGFDTNPDVNTGGSSVSGVYDTVGSGSFPQGSGTVEVCFKGGVGSNNCAGGGGGGVTIGNTGTFTAMLNFDMVLNALEIDNFVARYQSIDSATLNGDSGVGAGVVPIPAAAWLFGSALLGLASIKLRKAQA